MKDELKGFERKRCDMVEILSRLLRGWTEENNTDPQAMMAYVSPETST
jgi:hypothetical protein